MRKAACAFRAKPRWKNAIRMLPRRKRRNTKPSTVRMMAVRIVAVVAVSVVNSVGGTATVDRAIIAEETVVGGADVIIVVALADETRVHLAASTEAAVNLVRIGNSAASLDPLSNLVVQAVSNPSTRTKQNSFPMARR